MSENIAKVFTDISKTEDERNVLYEAFLIEKAAYRNENTILHAVEKACKH